MKQLGKWVIIILLCWGAVEVYDMLSSSETKVKRCAKEYLSSQNVPLDKIITVEFLGTQSSNLLLERTKKMTDSLSEIVENLGNSVKAAQFLCGNSVVMYTLTEYESSMETYLTNIDSYYRKIMNRKVITSAVYKITYSKKGQASSPNGELYLYFDEETGDCGCSDEYNEYGTADNELYLMVGALYQNVEGFRQVCDSYCTCLTNNVSAELGNQLADFFAGLFSF